MKFRPVGESRTILPAFDFADQAGCPDMRAPGNNRAATP